MKYTPLVSIVIPAYNAANYLVEAIESALAQTYSNIEVVVVNDGSCDNGDTEKIALSYGDKIRYFVKSNGGSSSALNEGIKNMRGEWFSWLSHDDLYYPQKIEKQIAYLSELAEESDAISNHVIFAGSEQIDAKGYVIKRQKIRDLYRIKDYLDSINGNQWLIAEPTRYMFHGCSCLVHKSVFARIGGFNEGLRIINDFDIWYRIYSSNYNIHFIPEILVKGRVHPKQLSYEIGYSYHNEEQDMFWNRSFEWLMTNYPNQFELFFLFGRNAYLKTRNREGDLAFDKAYTLEPQKKISLFLKKRSYKLYAYVRTTVKKVYLLIRN